jgi:hypothetical protein
MPSFLASYGGMMVAAVSATIALLAYRRSGIALDRSVLSSSPNLTIKFTLSDHKKGYITIRNTGGSSATKIKVLAFINKKECDTFLSGYEATPLFKWNVDKLRNGSYESAVVNLPNQREFIYFYPYCVIIFKDNLGKTKIDDHMANHDNDPTSLVSSLINRDRPNSILSRNKTTPVSIRGVVKEIDDHRGNYDPSMTYTAIQVMSEIKDRKPEKLSTYFP